MQYNFVSIMLTACDCDMFETMQVQPLVDEIILKISFKKKRKCFFSMSVFLGTSSVGVFLETCSVYIHNAFFKFTVYPKQLALFKTPSPLPLTPAHSENLHLYFRFFSCHSSLYFYSLLLCQCKQTQLSSENLFPHHQLAPPTG